MLEVMLEGFAEIINKSVQIALNQDQIKMSVKSLVAVSLMCPVINVFHP